ncbi:unnamed protein product [Dibothriocephalus latus]|uniref:Uncharacterized protein n=1 Tax=Dibothriocephalus latus TaxID=60516 RepID=A0A3P7L113_DIBLA|nr:unnamed protein product [Dibothriocephalus latus]
MEEAKAILEEAEAASNKLANQLEKLRLEFEHCKHIGLSDDEAAVWAVLKIYGRVASISVLPAILKKACVKEITSLLLRLTESLGSKIIIKDGTTAASKLIAKSTTAVVGGVAKAAFIGLNVALQVKDIYDLFKEIDADHPAATAIGEIISQLEGKIREAKKLRDNVNAIQRACQEAAEVRSFETRNRAKSRPAENTEDGAEDEDPKRWPNRRTCEDQIYEAEAERLIRLLHELVGKIRRLGGAVKISRKRLQSLLKRFIKILQKMYNAGFKCKINRRTRGLRLYITVSGWKIGYEISREAFHLCELDVSNMQNVFKPVPIGESSGHIVCNETDTVYYIRAVDKKYANIRYVGKTYRHTHTRVCEEHLKAIARVSRIYANEEEISRSDLNFLMNISYFYREAGMAANTLGLYEVNQLDDLLEVFCMRLWTEDDAELRFWETIWQWFFSTRTKEGGCNQR